MHKTEHVQNVKISKKKSLNLDAKNNCKISLSCKDLSVVAKLTTYFLKNFTHFVKTSLRVKQNYKKNAKFCSCRILPNSII